MSARTSRLLVVTPDPCLCLVLRGEKHSRASAAEPALSVRQKLLEVQPQLRVGAPRREQLVSLVVDPTVVRVTARVVV